MWKNKHLPSRIFLLLVCTPLWLQAQGVYDIKSLIDKVLIENYQVQISRNETRIAANNNSLGQAGFLPQVTLEAGQNMSLFDTRQELFTGALREGSAAKNTSLNTLVNVNWTIFDGFRMFANREKLTYLEELGLIETRYLIEQTISDVVLAYYQLVRDKALLGSIEENLKTSRFRYFLEKKRFDLGSGNALQVNQAQVDYYSDSILFLEQANLIRSLELQLGRYLLRDPSSPLSITDTSLIIIPLTSKENILSHALQHSPSARIAQLEEMIASSNVKIQRADLLPQIDVFGRYSYTYQTSEVGFAQTSRTIGPQFGVSIRLNLYNGGVEKKDIRNERILQENAVFRQENALYLLRSTIEDLYNRYASYEQQLALARENLAAASHSLSIARMQLEQGTISGYDFRLTQLNEVNARNNILRLEYTLKTIETGIDHLGGQLANKYL